MGVDEAWHECEEADSEPGEPAPIDFTCTATGSNRGQNVGHPVSSITNQY